jgi:hypothetical protein
MPTKPIARVRMRRIVKENPNNLHTAAPRKICDAKLMADQSTNSSFPVVRSNNTSLPYAQSSLSGNSPIGFATKANNIQIIVNNRYFIR